MKECKIYCDICGKSDAKTCYFTVDRKMDPAGSMEDVDEQMDLCRDHQWTCYSRIKSFYPKYEAEKNVLQYLKGMRDLQRNKDERKKMANISST